MPRRRLVVVAPSWERSGAEDHLATIAVAAAQAGWEVHAGLPSAPGVAGLREELVRRGVVMHRLAIGRPQRAGAVGAACRIAGDFRRTAAFLARVRPVVGLTVLPNPESSPGALLAATALRVPVLVVFQLVPPDLAVNDRRRRLYALARRRQRWVAISNENRRNLARAFGFDDERLIRIYNGVALTSPPNPEDKRDARLALSTELGLPDDAKLVLTVARLSHQKGHDVILDALPALWARIPQAVFLWAGSGELEGELRRRIREIGASDRVRLLGRRADVRGLLAAADLFLFPSRYEGLGFALGEAMAARVPIVASDQSAIPEMVRHGNHGLLFRLGDPQQLVDRIAWALGHPHEMAAMAERAAARVGERYGREEMITRTLDELASIASGRG